jgi:hypothetical protein
MEGRRHILPPGSRHGRLDGVDPRGGGEFATAASARETAVIAVVTKYAPSYIDYRMTTLVGDCCSIYLQLQLLHAQE